MTMNNAFNTIKTGMSIQGTPFSPTRESIRDFCEASLDFNPLHLDDEYTKGNFGKTNFGGIIMHGMNNFGIINKMLTDWVYPMGGIIAVWKRAGKCRSNRAIQSSQARWSRLPKIQKKVAGSRWMSRSRTSGVKSSPLARPWSNFRKSPRTLCIVKNLRRRSP